MMKNKWLIFGMALLVAILLASMALNYFLYEQARQYYLQLNGTRLDPLGLDYYRSAEGESTNAEQTLVVFFGDSRAASWSAPALEAFEFVNRGIGAQSSRQVLGRFEQHIKPLEPELMLLQVGVNDLKTIPLFPEHKKAIIANCKANIQQIVERSTDMGTTVILTTIFPIGEVPLERQLFWSDDVVLAINEVNQYIQTLAGENVVVFDADTVLMGEHALIKPEYSHDLLHLNEAGYEVLNRELVKRLQNLP
jgi:lysophospholipase L1-like esterase